MRHLRLSGIVEKFLPLLSFVPLDVLQQEPKSIVPRKENVLDDVLDAFLLEPQALASNDRRVDEVEPQSIRTVLVDDLARVGVIFLSLGHLLTVRGEDQSIRYEILERSLAEERGGNHQEGVEPASRLVNSFGYEISGETVQEVFSVLEGEMHLGVGHRTGLEPAVEYFRNSTEGRMARST